LEAQELRQKKKAVLDRGNGDPDKVLLVSNAEEVRKVSTLLNLTLLGC
jgi:hypothetical protein